MADRTPASQDPTECTSVVLFFVMIAVIVGSIALFLIFKPM
jgi:hypothetical protein